MGDKHKAWLISLAIVQAALLNFSVMGKMLPLHSFFFFFELNIWAQCAQY